MNFTNIEEKNVCKEESSGGRSIFPSRFVKVIFLRSLISTFLFFAGLSAEEILKEIVGDEIQVNLRNPEYSEGVLTTEEGGVIQTALLRVQAIHISYTHSSEKVFIEAFGELMIQYGPYVLVGDRIEYDFITRKGTLWNGRSGIDPWYFGGERIDLTPDGEILIQNGFVTTSQNVIREWEIDATHIHVDEEHNFLATDLYFRVNKVPFFWLPQLKTNLDYIFDSPIRYRVRWGGNEGLRLGVAYEILKWNGWLSFLRFDYRINRGPGGGFETYYKSPTGNQYLKSINYIANDPPPENPNELTRYRMEGIYHNSLDFDRFTFDLKYDKLSDKYMARDYYDKGLDLNTAGQTQLNIRRQSDQSFITNFTTCVRINDFQTVKQELPSMMITSHPLTLGKTGIVFESLARAGYLDFKYGDDEPELVKDYHSVRLEMQARAYRSSYFGPTIFTPEALFTTIWYENNMHRHAQNVVFGILSAELKSPLFREYSFGRHTLEPYLKYEWITHPTSLPHQHYIFDITDGWYDLNLLRFGARNLIFSNNWCGLPYRYLFLDSYAYLFINSSTLPTPIPRVYTDLVWDIYPTLRETIAFAWDTQHGMVDHYNVRTEWTINEDFAVSAEYRHRSAYAWRKAVYDNFILDNFLSETELKDSIISDRRDTFLCRLFLKLTQTLALQYQIRHGTNRFGASLPEPSYTEFQFDMIMKLKSSWNLRISYRNRENEHHRVALYISLGSPKP